jgi:hypothetical protein
MVDLAECANALLFDCYLIVATIICECHLCVLRTLPGKKPAGYSVFCFLPTFWGLLGSSWGGPRWSLRGSWSGLGGSEGSWGDIKDSWRVLSRSWKLLGGSLGSWTHWEVLGRSWGRSWALLGVLRRVLKGLGPDIEARVRCARTCNIESHNMFLKACKGSGKSG